MKAKCEWLPLKFYGLTDAKKEYEKNLCVYFVNNYGSGTEGSATFLCHAFLIKKKLLCLNASILA